MREEIARLHAQTHGFASRVQRARGAIERALRIARAPYVAFSGGKDSTVVLALVREYMPDIPAVWSDDEWYLPETEEYMARIEAEGVNLHHIRTNAWHTEWFRIAGDYDGIPDYAKRQEWDLVFLGLRQEESAKRRVHLRTCGLLYQCKNGFWHCNPIGDWTWRDVWAFILSRGLDYNRAYDRLAELGVPPRRQRIGPLAVERVLGYGQLAILKRGWPELFNRFAAEFPEVRGYV